MFPPRTILIAALFLCPLLAASDAHAQWHPQPSAQIAQDALPNAPSAHLAADLRANSNPLSAATQSLPPSAQDPATSPAHNTPSAADDSTNKPPQTYNLHAQYTFTGMTYTAFSAQYSNPAYLVYGTGSTLPTEAQARETESADGYFGYRLWSNTEFHFDALLWQGYGVNNTYGIGDFPDGEAFKVGVRYPHFAVARFFTRTTINLGGPQEAVEDDLLTLRGKQDTNRITITVGRFSVKDIFDNNQYSNDPRGQFMNWALMANAAYDYPADALGFTTGIAVERNWANWTLRYGWFQMSKYRNQFTAEGLYLVLPTEPLSGDGKIFEDWGMVTQLEHRHTIATHPGAVRLLVFDDRMNNGSYKAAVALANEPSTLAIWGTPAAFLASANGVTGGIDDTHALRNTWGLGLNMDQEITKNIGAFSRIGWNSGQNSGFEFTDTNWTATFGASIKGETWKQPDDVIGAAFLTSGISKANQIYHAAGGIGILTGDGALNYGPEKNVELYYDHKFSKYFHGAVDYQFVDDPAYNKDRGPIPGIFAIRLHFER
jgi:high affinity Mn2+ porin